MKIARIQHRKLQVNKRENNVDMRAVTAFKEHHVPCY